MAVFHRFPVVVAKCVAVTMLLPLFLSPLDGHEFNQRERQHWAFQKLVRPAVPIPTNAGKIRTPIDAFILNQLEARKLTFSQEATNLALLRRLYLDLLGLPPPSADIDAFLQDRQPGAYERVVDRLLASPHFGERWARHWLDEVGYADVTGSDNDATIISLGENRWRYRDYVIKAFNSDKPFDQFLLEQLAGDELVDWRSAKEFTPRIKECLIATGFLRQAVDVTDERELNTLDIRYDVLHRTVETVASNLLGLTLHCCRCHDHKFEPISHKDYYRFEALFQPAFNPQNWLQPKSRPIADVPAASKKAMEKRNADIDRRIDELQAIRKDIRGVYEAKIVEARLAKLPADVQKEIRAARQTAEAKRTEAQKQLLERYALALQTLTREVTLAIPVEDRETIEALDQQVAGLAAERRTPGSIQAAYDVGPPTPTHLLKRGNHEKPGVEVGPGFLAILCASEKDADLPTAIDAKPGPTSGRRLALARWLTQPDTAANGLLLRVRVNRVWQHLFGKGLVDSSENFGVTGTKPSHPQLLDWLGCEFAAQGQRLKPLIKLMVTSAVYRQTSASTEPNKVDPDNNLLWRMRLRRLEAEAIRDSILAVSGKLDSTMGGPPIPVDPRPDGFFVVKDKGLTPTSQWRRSVYLLGRRNYHPTFLNVFDMPTLTGNCTRRTSSAMVLQTLTMLNDAFVLDQADFIAQRIEEPGASVRRGTAAARKLQVEAAFRLILCRPPSEREVELTNELLERQIRNHQEAKASPLEAERRALANLCHMLLNSSEFLYVP